MNKSNAFSLFLFFSLIFSLPEKMYLKDVRTAFLNIGITSICEAMLSNKSNIDQSKSSSGQAYKLNMI